MICFGNNKAWFWYCIHLLKLCTKIWTSLLWTENLRTYRSFVCPGGTKMLCESWSAKHAEQYLAFKLLPVSGRLNDIHSGKFFDADNLGYPIKSQRVKFLRMTLTGDNNTSTASFQIIGKRFTMGFSGLSSADLSPSGRLQNEKHRSWITCTRGELCPTQYTRIKGLQTRLTDLVPFSSVYWTVFSRC